MKEPPVIWEPESDQAALTAQARWAAPLAALTQVPNKPHHHARLGLRAAAWSFQPHRAKLSPKGALGMRGLLAFGRAIDAMSAAAGKLADWLVLFACLISSGNAGVRYLFSYSSNA